MNALLNPVAVARAVREERLFRRIGAVVQAAEPKFGCLMAMLPGLEAEIANWAVKRIPYNQLAADGIETETHVTVLYGFKLDFDASQLRPFLSVPRIRLGVVSRFECPEYDVIKIDVESDDLVALNNSLSDHFSDQIVKSRHGYHPHITIAYVKNGACLGLDGNLDFAGRELYAGQAVYSLPEKQGRVVFDLCPSVAATEQGHPFWGNQWTEHAVHPAEDPQGAPHGDIKHAVLVIKNRRYRGPSHFQALASYLQGNPYDDAATEAVAKLRNQGFETESGHFLTREQAAQYMGGKNRQMRSEYLKLAARDGRLYTQDAVQAVQTERERYAAHIAAQKAAEAEHRAAARKALSYAEVAVAEGRAKDEDGRNALVATLLALLGGGAAAAYMAACRELQAEHPRASMEPTNTQAGQAANERKAVLKPLVVQTVSELELERKRAEVAFEAEPPATGRRTPAQESDLSKRLAEVAKNLESKRWEREIETEAQVTYGQAAIRLLHTGGFKTKRWVSMGDDRVRDSHVVCDAQGDIPLGVPFANGLMHPGDPKGPAHEVINCRCILTGGTR